MYGRKSSLKAFVNVYLTADKLNAQGMVTDFKHLGWFKKWLDNTIDHKFIVDINDPLLSKLTDDLPLENYYFEDKLIVKKISYTDDLEEHLKEYFAGFIIVDFIHTSENLSKWLCEIVEYKMSQIDVRIDKLEFFETPKSKSVYINK